MTTQFDSAESILASVGKVLGESEWLAITQERVNQFADATDDHQWIHVDVEKARKGPFGAPIAHGYLTLSLCSRFLPQIVQVSNVKMGVNYGTDKVRFPSPVKVNSKVRTKRELVSAELVAPNTLQLKQKVTVEIEGEGKPGCVAETLVRLIYG